MERLAHTYGKTWHTWHTDQDKSLASPIQLGMCRTRVRDELPY